MIRGGILNRTTEKPQKPTDNLPQWNRNRGKQNCICGIKNRTAFAVAVAVFDFQNLQLQQTAKYSRTDDEVEFYKEMEHMTTCK